MCSNGLNTIESNHMLLPQLVTLLKGHRPQGISLFDISREYYRLFGQRLNPNDFNVKSLYQLIEELSEMCGKAIVLVKNNYNQFKSDRIFIDEEVYDKWIQNFKRIGELRALERMVSPSLPSDVPIQHLNAFPSTLLPEDAFNGDKITAFRVKVLYIESPNLLYIRLRTNDSDYLNLRQNLRFYDSDDETIRPYVLPKELAIKGYHCVVRNPRDWENWNRAVILETIGENITLYAIDFGNILVEERKELRLMTNSLYELPPQAIRVSLTGIAPTLQIKGQLVWSEESIQNLKSLVLRNQHNIHCVFMFTLRSLPVFPTVPDFYSVLLHTDVKILVEDIPLFIPVYLHEKLIQNGFANMIPKDFNHITEDNDLKMVSEAIEEPLLAIKYEPEYESEAIHTKTLRQEIKSEPIDRTDVSITAESEVNLKSNTAEVATNSESIDYNRLYFTTDPYLCPQMKANSYFSKSDIIPLIERKYFTENLLESSVTSYERKYFTENSISNSWHEMSPLKYRYIRPDIAHEMFSSFMIRYYNENEEKERVSVRVKYFNESDISVDTIEFKYFRSDETPFVDNNYYRSDRML